MKRGIVGFVFLFLLMSHGIAIANGGYPWRDHAAPYDFLFNNHIDTHQQTQLKNDGDLFGFFYITFTGEITSDGLPVAKHCEENTPPSECVVGWILRGKPGEATFLYHHMDHPVWLVERADIPQPGAYSHFHWLDAADMPGGLITDEVYQGYFLELQAINTFAFFHAGQLIPVFPGIDIATHVNIVGSFLNRRAGEARADVDGEKVFLLHRHHFVESILTKRSFAVTFPILCLLIFKNTL